MLVVVTGGVFARLATFEPEHAVGVPLIAATSLLGAADKAWKPIS